MNCGQVYHFLSVQEIFSFDSNSLKGTFVSWQLIAYQLRQILQDLAIYETDFHLGSTVVQEQTIQACRRFHL